MEENDKLKSINSKNEKDIKKKEMIKISININHKIMKH